MDEHGQLGHQLPAETKNQLSVIENKGLSNLEALQKTSKAKRKEKYYHRLLESHPDIKNRLMALMEKMDDQGLALPLLHVTSGRIILPDGFEKDPGFVENIRRNGLQAGSHLSCFVLPGKEEKNANPADFAGKPEIFIRNLAEKVVRYAHHGYRTNKRQLPENLKNGQGQPVILLANAAGVEMVKGSDYPDHRVLKKAIPPEGVFEGQIILSTRVPFQDEDLLSLVDSVISLTERRLSDMKGGEKFEQ